MHHAPGSSAGFPANLMNIMTYWLLWCDVGKLTTDDPISWEKTASSSISSFFLLHSILSSLLFILFFCLLPSLKSPFVFSSSHCSLLHLLPLFYFFFFPVFLQCLFFILWIDHVPPRITIYFNHLFFSLLLILVLHPFCKELGFLVFLFLVFCIFSFLFLCTLPRWLITCCGYIHLYSNFFHIAFLFVNITVSLTHNLITFNTTPASTRTAFTAKKWGCYFEIWSLRL